MRRREIFLLLAFCYLRIIYSQSRKVFAVRIWKKALRGRGSRLNPKNFTFAKKFLTNFRSKLSRFSCSAHMPQKIEHVAAQPATSNNESLRQHRNVFFSRVMSSIIQHTLSSLFSFDDNKQKLWAPFFFRSSLPCANAENTFHCDGNFRKKWARNIHRHDFKFFFRRLLEVKPWKVDAERQVRLEALEVFPLPLPIHESLSMASKAY